MEAHRKIRFAQRATNDMTFIVYSRVLAALHTLHSQRAGHASSSASLFSTTGFRQRFFFRAERCESKGDRGYPPAPIRSIFDRCTEFPKVEIHIYKSYRRVKAKEGRRMVRKNARMSIDFFFFLSPLPANLNSVGPAFTASCIV